MIFGMECWDIFILCILCLNNFVNTAETPFKKICVGPWEISFFSAKKFFDETKQSCNRYGGHLVKVDNAGVQRAIENALGSPDGNRYFIGGERSESGFKWIADNTIVGASGYVNWKPGQPNNLNNYEDCMAIGDHYQYQWTDVACNYKSSDSRYICQRAKSNVTLNTNREGNNFTCQAMAEDISVKWFRNSKQVTITESGIAYQVIYTGKSVLVLDKPNIMDAGTYTCVGETKCMTVQQNVQVIADGTPTIQKTEDSKCNSSLFITWNPQKVALGYPHRIRVSPTQISDFFVIPRSNDSHLTEISGLISDTEYTAEITACLSKTSCNTGFKASVTNRTNGIYGLITSVVIANDASGGCRTSWWPTSQDKLFTLTTKCRINQSRNLQEREITSEKFESIKSTSYLFQPPPNRKCEVSVQVQECADASKALAAKGFCVTPTKEPSYVESPIIYGALQENSKLMMKVLIPSEENGLISCVFLIVCYGDCGKKNFTIDDLKVANKTAIENFNGDVYTIAIAISTLKPLLPIGPLTLSAHYFELSNGNTTQCNVYDATLSNSTDVEGVNFYGQNVIVNNSFNVGAFLVTTTPSIGRVLLKSSPVVIIRNKTAGEVVTTQNETKGNETETSEPINGNGWFAGLAVGVGVICLVIGAVSHYAFMRLRQRTDEPKDENNRRGNASSSTQSTRLPETQQGYPSLHSYENYPETPAYEEIGDGNKEASTYESYNA